MSDDETLQPIGADGQLDRIGEQIRRAVAAQPAPDLRAELERQRRHEAALVAHRSDVFATECPARFADATLDDLGDGPEAQLSRDWVLGNTGQNCVHLGAVGVGKTHTAVAQARAVVIGSGRSVWIVSAVALLDQLRPGGPEGVAERASTCGLLVLDDLGAERASDWTAERLAAIIDRRWLDQLPIIGTSNLAAGPGGTLEAALGERTYSRLVGSGAVVIQWPNSGDRRRQR